jgi:hypothetical protein
VLDDILEQSNSVLSEIRFLVTGNENGDDCDGVDHVTRHAAGSAAESARLDYLQAHLASLKATIAVLQQTLFTAQIIIWAK